MTENKETLVKNYSFKELVDVKTLQSFTDTLYSAFRLPSAIVTTDGEILTGSGWQKICTDFHRKNPESEKDCIESDTCLTKMIGEGKKYCIYKCPRGLVDSSSPVIVDGVHVANVFTGQFFSVSPTKETEKLFRKQAETFGFDQKAYMKAFKSIPVFPEEKHLLLLDVLVNLASMLSEIGLTRKRELDKTKQVLVSEEKFRKYISHAPDGIFIVDARGFYVEVNQAACKLTGYSESELTSMSIPDIVASDDDIPSESLKDLQKSGSVKLEFRLRRKDGTIIWASLEAVTISEDRFMAFCSDITERKLAGDELLRERNILQEVMNGAKDIHLVYLDRDFNFVRVNKTYSDTCGYKPNEMIGKNHFDLYPNAENEAIFKKVRDTGEPFHIKDKPFSFPDQPELGVTYWDWSLCPVKGKQGDVEGLIFSLVETTKRKQTENSLRESEERLHQSQVIAGIGDFIWDIPSGKATWSEGMYELLKYDKNEIIDYEKVNVAIHHPDDLERVTKWLTDNLAYGQEILTPNEYRLICKDGEVIHVQTNGRIDYRDGKAIKLFGTCIDITERKLAEKKLTATTTFLDRIVDMSPFAMWVSNSEGVMIRSNRSLRDTMGLTDEQLIGNYNVLKDENLVKQNLMPQVKSVFEKHEAVRFDMIWNVSDSGGIKFDESHNYHIDVSLFPVVDSDGKLVNIVCQWVDITERKQIENKIVKLNNELQNSIANMPNAYILWDLDLKILEWNKAAERIFGYTKEEMLGKNAADFIVPEDVRHLVGDVLLKLQVGDVADYSEKDNNIRKDGSLISCQWHNTPLIDANGKVYAILTLAQDITERKKAEEKILQNKVLLESSLESQKDTIILSLDREYRYLYFNKAHSKSMINAYGTKPELGLSIFDIIQVDEDIVRLKAHYDRALTGDRHTIIEDYGGEDSRLFFEINFNPIYDNNKKIIGLSVFAQDITERKRAEVALRENDEKLRTYISSAPDGIFIINSDAKFIEVNDTGCKIMGYPESELLQLSPIDVLDPEYIEKFKNNFDILKEKGSSKGEYKVITKSGKLIWISIDAVALSKDEVMAFGSDISETKRLQELESRAERLETAGTIAGQVAHDFNNLLAPMVAYPEFIRDELPDDHPTLKYLDQIEQAAQKIADINQQLL
ncbi:MAG: PAS domain S-box protein, partial [candidate division Zixibacteria bacterium]|nr:PAS domain S-box protein [candidate division Zixibacteria bacterium]